MPKPVKKAAKKKPSTDPNKRAHQLMDAHLDKLSQGKFAEPAATPPNGDLFEEQFRKRMAELGRKGGKVGGKRRMTTMTAEERSAIALKAAEARWEKQRTKKG